GQRAFNSSARTIIRAIFGAFGRVRLAQLAPVPRTGPLILASNHISHFDPPLLGSFFPRHVDWMAMEELFRNAAFGRALALTGAFRVNRDGTDRTALRAAVRRLRAGRVVGIFPEGGIRAGATSILEGAPMRPGVAVLALLSGAPILPCVLAGTDRFYHRSNWLLLRRPPVWILTGEPITPTPGSDHETARAEIRERLAAAFITLKAQLIARFDLSECDLPHTPQARKGEDPYA
ncbi:MAG: lysophospholipid acyltransferase family protein, partial [Terrimicrobiaceae bacterium]|nr:lysophospholipid acyltransferase family protein [Terrimicrobiaceae bacterium]